MSAHAQAAGLCSFCGLPVVSGRRVLLVETVEAAEPEYCCFGCRFAASIAGEQGPEVQTNWTMARLALGIFLSMQVMVFTMFLWSWDVYDVASGEVAPSATILAEVFRYLCLLLTLPVLWALGWPLLDNTWRALRRWVVTTDLLLVLGIGAAFVYSAWSVYQGTGHIYFEITCMVLVFVTLGRWFEATGRIRTSAALDDLERLLPDNVTQVVDGTEQLTPLGSLQSGDVIRVRAGERIGVDGKICRGVASIDAHLLNGESHPVTCESGDTVWGGSLNLDGDLLIEVLACARDGALQRMIDAVHRARHAKGRYERLADRVAVWFTPAMMSVALATFAWHTITADFQAGLLAALSVVLIACPCALGLATPLAVWTSLGAAAQRRVLFRSGEAIEKLASIRSVCLDKTGTLSTSNSTLLESVWGETDLTDDQLRLDAWFAASASTHPLAASLRAALEPVDSVVADHTIVWTTYPGRGIVGRDESGKSMYLGSSRLMRELDLIVPPHLAQLGEDAVASGHSVMWFAVAQRVRALFVFEEALRPSALPAIQACQQLGLHVQILTGDQTPRAQIVARQLHLEVQAELLPNDKLQAVEACRNQWGAVAMVGDGVNDAAALTAADVGIALGCGTDVTRDSADVCLLGNDLNMIPWSFELARRTVRTIRQNLFWAFVYNALGIVLAASGRLNPLWAAAAMVVSSLFVIGNSLRLAERSVAVQAPGLGDSSDTTDSQDASTDRTTVYEKVGAA